MCPELKEPQNARVSCIQHSESEDIKCTSECFGNHVVTIDAMNHAKCGPSTHFEWRFRSGQNSLPDCMGKQFDKQQTTFNHYHSI